MKNLNSTIEGVWKERVIVPMTAEQRKLMSSKSEDDKVARKALIDEREANSLIAITTEESDAAQALYLSKKPVLEEGQTYSLIGADISMEGENGTGLINCRVNEEHKQIRF